MEFAANAPEMSGVNRLSTLLESFERFLAFGLRAPDLDAFQKYFPNLPHAVVEALLDLYRQVLLHVETNSKAEFSDICVEHSIKERLEEIEELCNNPNLLTSSSVKDPAAQVTAAATQARVSAKQAEVAFLQMELARAESERDRLAAMQQQRQLQVQQLSAGYQSIGDSMRMVHDASKDMMLQQQG